MKYLLGAFLFINFFSCSSSPEKPGTDAGKAVNENTVLFTDSQVNAAGIKTVMLTEKDIKGVIRVNGKIDVPPQNLVSVSIGIGGYLKSTKLLPGMHLKKGELIATLEDQQYIQLQQEYLTSKARLELAEADYNRQRELNSSKAGSDKVMQQARADYQALKITMNGCSEKLKLINIDPLKLNENTISGTVHLYAPFDGYVSKVNVNIGKYVTPSNVMFELVNPNDIHLNLLVFEKDLAELAIGQKLIAYTNIHPDKKYGCEIILISKDITTDHTAEVHCHFDQYDKNLLPGMYMNAEIEISNRKVRAIPENAILTFEGKNYVFIKKSSREYEMHVVETGDFDKNVVEIKNAEDFRDKEIVTSGAYTLLMYLKNSGE